MLDAGAIMLKSLRYVAALGVAVLALPASAQAQDYPTRPITIVSAQASGGASDTVTRAIQDLSLIHI